MQPSQANTDRSISSNPLRVRSTCTYPVKKVVNVQLDLPDHY